MEDKNGIGNTMNAHLYFGVISIREVLKNTETHLKAD